MTEEEKKRVMFPTLYEELESELSNGEKQVLLDELGGPTNAVAKAQLTIAIYVVKKFQKMTKNMIDSNNESAKKMYWLTIAIAAATIAIAVATVLQLRG